MFTSFTGLWKPVKGTKVSTVLSTPGAGDHTALHLDIGMGGHFEGFGVVKAFDHGLKNYLFKIAIQSSQTARLSSLEDRRDYLKNRQR